MIQVLQRTISILEYIASSLRECTLGELAEHCGISNTTCSNIVKDLAQAGYIEQEGKGKGYRLGAMAFGLSLLSDKYAALRYAAEPVLHRLAEETGETALLSTLVGSRKLVISYVEGYETIRFALERGIFDDIHWTAGGAQLLAHTEPIQKKWIYRELHKRWGKNKEAKPWLEKLPDEEKRALASPCFVCETEKVSQHSAVIRHREKVIAALGIFIPQFRATEELRARVEKALIDGTEEISAKLTSGFGLSK